MGPISGGVAQPSGSEMTRFVAFLRGVNVGGVTLKMADVSAALTAAGFTNVRTVLASGNVLLDAPTSADAARTEAQAALRETFGYDAWVLAYELSGLLDISANFPFERELPGHHSYVTFVADPQMHDELAALAEEFGTDERIARGDGVLYWQVPRTATLGSTVGQTMGTKRYKSSTTTRNLRTLDKVLRLG